MAKKEAVDATVSGDDQQVGFRALVMKQAIEYNLAGSASNDPNQSTWLRALPSVTERLVAGQGFCVVS